MTSKKRVDIAPGEGEMEPKRPRGDDAEETQSTEVGGHTEATAEAGGSATTTDSAAASGSAAAATGPVRKSRDWLSFSGRREPRVGGDFQVNHLPSPGDADNNNDNNNNNNNQGANLEGDDEKENTTRKVSDSG